MCIVKLANQCVATAQCLIGRVTFRQGHVEILMDVAVKSCGQPLCRYSNPKKRWNSKIQLFQLTYLKYVYDKYVYIIYILYIIYIYFQIF